MKISLTPVFRPATALREARLSAWLIAGALALSSFAAKAQLEIPRGPAATGIAVSAAEPLTPVEQCLLARLRTADPRATVAEVHAACEPAAALLTAPAEGQTAAGESTASQAELLAPLSEKEAQAQAEAEAQADALAVAQADAPPVLAAITSPVQRRAVSEARLWSERFALLPHRPNYILPFSHVSTDPGPGSEVLQRNEIKLQLSFKFPLTPPLLEGRAAVFFAYTGQYWWQAYNKDISAPFREYGHEPEIFVAWRPSFSLLGWSARSAQFGYVHQSNGRAGELSRSWNRLFAEVTLDRPDGWWLALRPWWRIPEDAKDDPTSPRGDDNPEISRYAGDGELRLGHVGDADNWTLTLRRGLRSGGKGAMQLDWSRPTRFSPHLRWYAQYYEGYGESLLDHDRRLQRFGLGVMLNDWF